MIFYQEWPNKIRPKSPNKWNKSNKNIMNRKTRPEAAITFVCARKMTVITIIKEQKCKQTRRHIPLLFNKIGVLWLQRDRNLFLFAHVRQITNLLKWLQFLQFLAISFLQENQENENCRKLRIGKKHRLLYNHFNIITLVTLLVQSGWPFRLLLNAVDLLSL